MLNQSTKKLETKAPISERVSEKMGMAKWIIELYYQRILVMQNRIQELETKLINYDRKN